MDRSTRSLGWTILVMAAGLAWLLPARGMKTPERFATPGSRPSSRRARRMLWLIHQPQG